MSSAIKNGRCDQTELISAYALGALSPAEVSALEMHIAECPACQRVFAAVRTIMGCSAAESPEFLWPSTLVWQRLIERIAAEPQRQSVSSRSKVWSEPEWEEVAPGISCKLLASSDYGDRVSMLVRLAPGVAYPPHSHAGVEELHLLHGELWIDGRKLYPGDFNRAEPGTADKHVWSETGCTCVLITSPRDVLR